MSMTTDPRDILKKFETGLKPAEVPEFEVRLEESDWSDKKIERFEWYEKGWLPVKGLRLLAGATGIGKSTVFIHEIAKLVQGQYEGHDPIDVLYMTTEGNDSMTAARMKLAGCFNGPGHVREVHLNNVKTVGEEEVAVKAHVRLKHNLELVKKYLAENPSRRAIFLDPINSLLGVDEIKDDYAIGVVLEEVLEFANEYEVVVCGMKHTKKEQPGTATLPGRSQIFGTAAWGEKPILIHMLHSFTDKIKESMNMSDDEAELLMYPVKSNYSSLKAPSKGFVIEEADLRTEDGELIPGVTKMKYLGERDINDDDIIEAKSKTREEAAKEKQNNHKVDDIIKRVFMDNNFEGLIKETWPKVQAYGVTLGERQIKRRISGLGVKTESIEGTADKKYVVPKELREQWSTNMGFDF